MVQIRRLLLISLFIITGGMGACTTRMRALDMLAQCTCSHKTQGGLTSRHRAPALLETYTLILLAKFFPTEPEAQEE